MIRYDLIFGKCGRRMISIKADIFSVEHPFAETIGLPGTGF